MKKALKIIGLILLILIAAVAIAWFGFLKPAPPPISEEDRAAIKLMPLPAELKLGSGEFFLDTDLSHEFTALSTPRLKRTLERFYKKLGIQTGMEMGNGTSRVLILECSGSEQAYPSLEDNESYTLKVSEKKIHVTAPQETGIIYALETLLQLVSQKEGQWVIPVAEIEDQPRYPWRGLMIDACRHWIPKEVILRNLDAMGALKMNVFHWHLTESQAFRIESRLYPRLHAMGSHGDFYTQEDIREVVEFAADRGIRVIPEFDVPGHTAAWFVGHPELASAPGPYELDTGMMGVQPTMDPTRDETYHFLDSFLGEMTGLFPDEYLHIGGDEVVPTQWNESHDIQAYMKDHKLEDPHALQAHFNIRLQKIVEGHGRIMMGWDEILHPDLPGNRIAVQTWRNHESLWESARQGYNAVLSAGYYLDHKQTAAFHYRVDPMIIPGAVEIEVDPVNWKAWDCTLSIAEMAMDGALYFFGEGDSLRGVMSFMDSNLGFEEVISDGDQVSFVAESPMGDLEFNLELQGDSLSGSSKISVFNLNISGNRSGGSDMESGIPLPEFKKIEALTIDQQSRLIGGEACMWTEMVDALTIDSRIWPRAAAVAEKMWSPGVLTGDVEDMYRRLIVLDKKLEYLGLQHRNYRKKLMADMVAKPYLPYLEALSETLQEDKMFARMAIYRPMFYFTTPLNRMVDVARPESYVAYQFGKDVDQWVESRAAEIRDRLIVVLENWSVNHSQLAPAFENNERLLEIKAHSEHLSLLAEEALKALTDPNSLAGRDDELIELFASASASYGATNLAIVTPVQKLIQSAIKN